ncbi:MAG TPA: M48 family metalloprotease [Solirubrobacteraceae bacterium]|nr:M48 family metalloprotease [Solirubrobacteraceae bacterium]
MHGRLRVPIAVAAAVAAGEAAVELLRPRRGLIAPEPVAPASYFSAAEIDRGRRFRRGQRALGAAAVAVEAGLLGALAARPPAALSRAPRRPVAASAVAGAALSGALGVATLPLAALGRRRAVAVGLSTQSWGGWAADRAKAGAVGGAVGAAGAAGAVALMRRAGARWWLPGSAVAVAAAAAGAFAAPVLLEPLFLRFAPLPDGPLRSDVLALAERAGVRVRDVLVADASRRTSGANAYVSGVGRTRRVVLFDTLVRDFTAEEVGLVVAHELSHVRHRDVVRSLGLLALGAPAALHAVAALTERLAPPRVTPGPPWLPALALAGGAVSAATSVAGNRLSRAVERRADADALRVAGAPAAFEAFHRRIALQNVADLDPPRALVALAATHPTTAERIGIARAYAAGAGGSD